MPQIEIRVKGQIDPCWSEWFGGLAVGHAEPDETVITGQVPDQAALYGIISRLRDLGLELSLVIRSDPQQEDSDS